MMNSTNQDEFTIPADHVSETAYWVAAFRLEESKRPDRHFNDSLAAKLLAHQSSESLERRSSWKLGSWMMAVRTTVIDHLIMKLIEEEKIDTVVNLAAGLDTRPYRLALPKNLKWIEADLEGIIQFKTERLKDDQPVCQLTRVTVNLASPPERKKFFESLHGVGKFIVLTEGLLLYLNPEDVHGLSDELSANPNLKAWLMDISTLTSFKAMRRISGEAWEGTGEAGGKVHFKFLPEEGIHYFDRLGWKVREFQSYYEQGKILNRNLPSDASDASMIEDIKDVGIGVLSRGMDH